MKKMAAVIFITLILIVPAFTNGGKEQNGDKKVVLSQMVSQGWTEVAHEEIAARFTEETGIQIDWQVTPADQHHDLLKTKLNAGEAPDIFWVQTNPNSLRSEIDPEKNAIDFSNEDWIHVMEPTRLPAVSYNGKVFGQMFWYGSVEFPMFYNKTLFEEMGLEVPVTYEEFKNVATSLYDGGITPIYEHVPSGWHHVLYIMQIGGVYEQQDPGLYDKLNNNEKKVTEVKGLLNAITQLNEFAQSGFFGEDYLSNTGSDVAKQLADRKVAMYCTSAAMKKTIDTDYPDCTDEWGIFLIPFADNQTFPNNPAGPAMFGYSKSPYEKEIREYFSYTAQVENLQYLLDNHPTWTNIDLSSETESKIEQHFLPMELEFANSLKADQTQNIIMQTGVKYMNEQWMDMGSDLEAMFLGQMTPEEVLQSIQERRDRMAKAQNDPAW